MCGRFTITLTKEDFLNYLTRYTDVTVDESILVLPRYNIAPSENIIAMIEVNDTYRVGQIKWGFTPSFGQPKQIINARAETILEKRLFKNSLLSKRCIIFADSFYEWKTVNDKKIPYRIMVKDQKLFAFAGIWTSQKKDQETIYSAAIITTKANQLMTSIHERMPVILTDDHILEWIKPTFNKDEHLSLLKPYASEKMIAYEVSAHVNQATHKDRSCILQKENTIF